MDTITGRLVLCERTQLRHCPHTILRDKQPMDTPAHTRRSSSQGTTSAPSCRVSDVDNIGRLNIAQEEQPELERYANTSEMPPWFQVFYAQYVRQREDMRDTIAVLAKSTAGFAAAAAASDRASQIEPQDNSYMDFDDNPEDPYNIDPAKFKLMNLNITLLESGILFHSVFVGMTISITSDGFITLLVAILFHQFFEGLGLGSRIAAVPYKPGAAKPWILVAAFGLTCPIGQVIGLATRDTYDESSAFALILVGFFNAL